MQNVLESFSPQSAAYGSTVAIHGLGLVSVTGVKFNGTPAIFTIDSNTQITATVPTGATDGPIEVVIPCGSVASSAIFHPLGWRDCGAPVTVAPGDQLTVATTSDGSGGAIVTWNDSRSGNYDIYVQRMRADGHPMWTAEGVALCVQPNDQNAPKIASDGAGGVIITWYDARSGSVDVYAQRVDAAGVPQWAANGVPISTAAGNQYSPTIASDGAGGAIITWNDSRSGDYDIYAQRVNASGVPQWTDQGVGLCIKQNDQNLPMIISDRVGGAIVTWYDARAGSVDVFAQRVNADGEFLWSADGVVVSTAAGNQYSPTLASDGAEGAIITWNDNRSGDYDIYAQRVKANGATEWTPDGVGLCIKQNDQNLPMIISDGVGGAIITWYDARTGSVDAYAQRVNAAGEFLWSADGVPLSTAAGNQYSPTLASDGAEGAIVTWNDSRSGNYDIYAQRIKANGATEWTWDGVALCVQENDQNLPVTVSDGAGGAIVAWYDARSGTSTDIYAQRLGPSGQVVAVPPVAAEPQIATTRAWPNPFADQVHITFSIPVATAVHLEVFDVLGRRVLMTQPRLMDPGRHSLVWDGRADDGSRTTRGIYFLHVRGPGIDVSRRVVRLE